MKGRLGFSAVMLAAMMMSGVGVSGAGFVSPAGGHPEGPPTRARFKKQSRRSFGKATRKSPHTKARCKWIGGQPLLFRP